VADTEISDLLAPAASFNHKYIVPPSAAERFLLLASFTRFGKLYRWRWRRNRLWRSSTGDWIAYSLVHHMALPPPPPPHTCTNCSIYCIC